MEEIWALIENFPMYSVSNLGRVRNDKRKKIVTPSFNPQGALKVGLVGPHGLRTKSVKVLVATAFVPGRTEIYDTPMLLDGDQTHLTPDNIVWRPLWFAQKYARQITNHEDYINSGPIVDRKTGEVYESILHAGLANGLLLIELKMSLVTNTPVFPTWHIFDWWKE